MTKFMRSCRTKTDIAPICYRVSVDLDMILEAVELISLGQRLQDAPEQTTSATTRGRALGGYNTNGKHHLYVL